MTGILAGLITGLTADQGGMRAGAGGITAEVGGMIAEAAGIRMERIDQIVAMRVNASARAGKR